MRPLVAIMLLTLGGIQTPAQTSNRELPSVCMTNVMIPMRDGIQLSANIFLPKSGGPFPAILQRTPYGKLNTKSGEAQAMTAKGYAVISQDCRGRGPSQGKWEPFRYDAEDGFDTQEWVGTQKWCNGRLGTWGGSYVGWTQWAAAVKGSRHLVCMAPVVPFTDPFHEISFTGGAFQLALCFGWGASVGGVKIPGDKYVDSFKYLPLNRWDEQWDRRVFYLRDWVAHNTYDDYWAARGIDGRYDKVTVPVMSVGGWYDIFSKATLDQIASVSRLSGNALARSNQYVIMGPWGHGVGGQKTGELDFGPNARLNIGRLQAEWFDYWLKNSRNDVVKWPPIRLFVMGENLWRNEREWPLARTRYTAWYLHNAGKRADGTLDEQLPANEKADDYIYDPGNPVPTLGGNNLGELPAGPFDQKEIEERSDVLLYTSEPLREAMEVTGPVKVVLHVSSSAPDTDFTAKLVDVYPDGKAYNLCDGIIRAKHWLGSKGGTSMKPGETYEMEIDLWVTSNVFKKQHRIRVEISSSNFPRFDRNLNTGVKFGTGREMVTARQTIHHSQDHPSRIILPVIPR